MTTAPQLELDNNFCYKTLTNMEGYCAKYVVDQSIRPIQRIAYFIINRVCFETAERLDADPSAEYHQRVEQAVKTVLVKVLQSIDNAEPDIVAALDSLLSARANI